MPYFAVYGVSFAIIFRQDKKCKIRILVKVQILRDLRVIFKQISPDSLAQTIIKWHFAQAVKNAIIIKKSLQVLPIVLCAEFAKCDFSSFL